MGQVLSKGKVLSEVLPIFNIVFRLVSASQLKYQAAPFYNKVSYIWETSPRNIVEKIPTKHAPRLPHTNQNQ